MNLLRKAPVLVGLLFIGLFLCPRIASADTTSYRSAATVTTDGSPGYTNLGNCSATDGFTCDRASSGGFGNLYFHNFGDFGIPDGSTIINVRIRVTGKATVSQFALFAGVSLGNSYTVNCQFPSDIWTMGVLTSQTIQTYTATTSITKLGGCLSLSDIQTDNYIWRVNYSGTTWSASIDDFEIAFDYTPPATPTPTPSPTATPTPTPLPTPAPFLDLPWDYEGKGISFNDAALAINSYFDHEYPLLSSGLNEPAEVIPYDGKVVPKREYTSHDGYDYGRGAKVDVGDPVLAAAPGWATYVNSCIPCGNMIEIDHQNGYQTRYLHMQKDGLVTDTPGQKVWVHAGDPIGKVGATGNVQPAGDAGAHIHFGVIEDKNHDGNFDDNIPDGLTDPFGWQSSDPDPWPTHSFFYNGLQRMGNKSYYLWEKKLDSFDTTLTANGGGFNAGHYTIILPPDQHLEAMSLAMQSEPTIATSEGLKALEPLIRIVAKDPGGTLVTAFTHPFSLAVDFAQVELSLYKTDTISIYSSEDDKTWKKEDTTVDMLNKKATAQINHLSHFALLAEPADTVAPVTTADLQGDQGYPGWYRSNVSISFNSVDNDGGVGVDYTMYRIDNGDWNQYTIPLTFNNEGHYVISFYSADKAENIEGVKTVAFDIDKTAPTVMIDADPKIIWPPNGKLIPVTVSGSSNDTHLVSTTFSVSDEYGRVQPPLTSFEKTIQLEAARNGFDIDGRKYTISATAQDKAQNTVTAQVVVRVPHDQK